MKQNFKKFCEHFRCSFCRISLPFFFTFPCSMFAQVSWTAVVRHLQQRGHTMGSSSCTTVQWGPNQKISAVKNSECRTVATAWSLQLWRLSAQWYYHPYMNLSRSLIVHSWFSQEYKFWYILHLEWAFSFKRKSKFLEIWDWHSIALNRSIFYS